MYFVFKFSFNVKVSTPEGQHPNQVLCDITVSMPFSRRDHLLLYRTVVVINIDAMIYN